MMGWIELAIIFAALLWALVGPPTERPRYWPLWFMAGMIVFLIGYRFLSDWMRAHGYV